ncbi:MAG: rhomboid family intramembrane serine protease [Bacilli bacterium]
MNETKIEAKNEIVIKLLHYFITKQGYNPVVLYGAQNEIWLENMERPYKLIRIVSNHIHNMEQYDFDMFKTQKIMRKLKIKTFSLKMKMLSIFTDIGDNVNLTNQKNIDTIYLSEDEDIKNNILLTKMFKGLEKDLEHSEKGTELFVKITRDLNKKNQEDAKKTNDVFSKKVPYITYAIILINALLFFLMEYVDYGSNNYITLIKYGASYTPLIRGGEYYRLITSNFLHIGLLHFIFNNYALYILGSYIESFYGKIKFIIIYLFSGLFGSLLSMLFVTEISAGASGAIFGLMGSMIYFGYHYRAFLGTVLKQQIIPLIIINLLIGFSMSGINNAAHIGGLIGGLMISIVVGVKYKTSLFERINGLIATVLMTLFIGYMAFFYNDVYRDKELDNYIIDYYRYIGDHNKANNYKKKVTKFD